MNYHKKLIDFMKLKASFLPKPYNRYYMTDGDAKDVMKWTDEYAKSVYKELLLNIKNHNLSANRTCIFCIYVDHKKESCISCSYGKRHGICEGPSDSLYGKIYFKGICVVDAIYNNKQLFLDFLTKGDNDEKTETTKTD